MISFALMSMELKLHWDKIYTNKSDVEVSWFEKVPATSLKLIEELKLGKADSIIDVGGGNSNLTSELLRKGYHDLSVLDISTKSIEKMKRKMGEDSMLINWIDADILNYSGHKKYHIWHDRAVFHFLADLEYQKKYKSTLLMSLKDNGYLILSTFSTSGPEKCSGLDVCRHDEKSLQSIFGDSLQLLNIFNEDHTTPLGGLQNFIFSVWKKYN